MPALLLHVLGFGRSASTACVYVCLYVYVHVYVCVCGSAAVSALNRFASQVGGTVPNLDTMLPRDLFGERGALLHKVRSTVEELSEHMYVRIVDKGAGVLWAFCKHWLWKQTEQFLVKEQYSTCAETPDAVRQATAALICERGWNANPRARMCVLYIIGKAKSLLKGQWLWRPIAAYPEPQIRKLDLRTAARAFTCFLKHLIQEVPNSFQVLRVNDVASWVTWAGKQRLTHITELDCKEQFNKIKPSWIDEHLKEGIAFIAKRRRWRMSEVTWSVHHTAPALDRPGLGTSKSFRYILHQVLSEYVRFELQRNNKCWAVGKLWSRDLCIPMGGSFSAQSADLHSVWGAYTGRQERLGALTISPEGYVLWTGRWRISLCQFRDNILMATDARVEDCREVVSLVKSVLERVWGLPVECNCADKQGNCQGACLGPVLRCMGFCISLGGEGKGLNHVHPAALTDTWDLRLGPSLMNPRHAYKGYLSGIFTGALANGRAWVSTWAGEILSALAWLQAGMRAGYTRQESMRAMHRALHRAFAGEPHFLPATVKAVYTLSHRLPAPKCVIVAALQKHLKQFAHWEGERYTSWAPRGCPGLHAYEVIWNYDWRALERVREQCCPGAGCVCVSPR